MEINSSFSWNILNAYNPNVKEAHTNISQYILKTLRFKIDSAQEQKLQMCNIGPKLNI